MLPVPPPAPDVVPAYVEYDRNGTRARKHFDDITDPACKRFFTSKSRAGKNPVLRRADGQPAHVSSDHTQAGG